MKQHIACLLCGASLGAKRKYCGERNLKKSCSTCEQTFFQKCQKRESSFCSIGCQNRNPSVIAKANRSRELADFQEYAHERWLESFREKYGVSNPSQLQEVKAKKEAKGPTGFARKEFKKRMMELHGAENPGQLLWVREKVKKTSLKRYGTENPAASEEVKRKISEGFMEKYGVKSALQLPRVQRAVTGKRISKLNMAWKEKLERNFSLEFDFEVEFGGSYADLGYENLLVDINPGVSHNSSINFAHAVGLCKAENCQRHRPISKSHHQERSLRALSEGFILITIFDWHGEKEILRSVERSLVALSGRSEKASAGDLALESFKLFGATPEEYSLIEPSAHGDVHDCGGFIRRDLP